MSSSLPYTLGSNLDLSAHRAEERRKRELRAIEVWDQLTAALRALGLKVKRARERGNARRIKEIDGVECTGFRGLVTIDWLIPDTRGMRIVVRPPRPARPSQFRASASGSDFKRIATAIAEAVASTHSARADRNAADRSAKSNERALRRLRRSAPELAQVLDETVNAEAAGFFVTAGPLSVQAVERIAKEVARDARANKTTAVSRGSDMRKNR